MIPEVPTNAGALITVGAHRADPPIACRFGDSWAETELDVATIARAQRAVRQFAFAAHVQRYDLQAHGGLRRVRAKEQN
jgi:hypothetical protein